MERPRPLILLALALLAVLAAYAPSLTGTFLWDDHMLIVENPRAHELAAPSEFFTRAFWSTPFQRVRDNVHSFYRPLVGLSYALDWVRSNGEPAAFHFTNVLLHLLVVALVFALARQLGASGRAAAVAAGAFGLLPRLTESVAWISGRTDVLAACFALLALFVERAGPPRWGRRVAVALLLLAGLFSKEVTLAVGLVIVLLAVFRALRGEAKAKTEAVLLLPLPLALLAYLAMRRSAAEVVTPLALNSPAVMLRVLGHYASMALVPWLPNAQPGFLYQSEPLFVALGAATAAGVAALAVWLWRTRRDAQLSLVVGAAAALSLVVALQLVGYTVAADRFLYLPLALACVALAPALDGRRAGLKQLAAAALALSFGPVTFARAKLWTDELRFWERTVAQGDPRNPPLWGALADAYFEQTRLVEALALFEKAVGLYPVKNESALLSLAVCQSRLGDDAKALAGVDALVRDYPDWRRALYDSATFRSRALDFEGARAAVALAEQRLGHDPVLEKLRGLFDQSEAQVKQLGPETPGDPPERVLTWAELYEKLGATGKARVRYQRVAGDPASSTEQRRRALSYLVIKGEPEAARHALKALRALPGEDAQAVEALASLLADRLE